MGFVPILLLSLCSLPSPSMDRITGKSFATRSEVIAKHGMAATSQPLATQVALDVLKAGGSAVDAAIAANAMLCLVEPTGCGIGGDLFAIVWDAKGERLHGLNASGRSPSKLTAEEFERLEIDKIPKRGALPVSVPGCVDGWSELHKKFGRLPLSQVLAPAVRYAREGAPITELIAHYWKLTVPLLSPYPGFDEVFQPNGHPLAKGEMFQNPGLANTLERIGAEGRDAFYRGETAQTIADYVQAQGGYLSTDDLAKHTSEWVDPVSIDYRGYRLWELPPNGQGIAALQILAILEAYDLAAMGFGSADYVHHFIEAKKLAFEDRARFYADPDFNKIPVEELISDEYAAKRRALIDPKKAGQSYPAGNPNLEEGDTIYLTVADDDGNMVSLIQSNYRGMGSGMTPPGLGFILQNRGELFDLTQGRFNSYAPNKRPFHTIIPAFVTKDGKPWMSYGVMGGATQPQAHAQVLINIVDFGMNIQEAGDAPRILHSESSQPTGERMTDGGQVHLESGFDYEVIRQLVQRKHTVGWKVGPFGGYQAIRYDAEQGVYYGASESRKDGQAGGY
ncbi:MAG: gamma-glutamyltranspeptidase/glutathione hydrolase [Planctomycetota bacterium]|jgi:gamma-glutamyltranspeptidase/glutathione hydrolase